jgi:hypothetical protein
VVVKGGRVDEVICNGVGQLFFCGTVGGIRGANVLLLLFIIIAEKGEFVFVVVEEEIEVLVLCECVFAGGEMRNDLVEIDDEGVGIDA